MTITVGDIYTQFPSFKPQDMIKLVGRSDFNNNDAVSLKNIAMYNGEFAEDLSIFTAERAGKSYTNMLEEDKQKKINAEAGIKETQQSADNKSKAIPSNISMDTSIFDIDNKKNTGIYFNEEG